MDSRLVLYVFKRNGESVDLLFLHCPIAFEMRSMVFTLFGIYWVMPKTLVDLLACWQGKFGRHHNGVIWMVVPRCLMGCIWWERNSQCFEDSKRTIADLKLFFFRMLSNKMSIIGSFLFF